MRNLRSQGLKRAVNNIQLFSKIRTPQHVETVMDQTAKISCKALLMNRSSPLHTTEQQNQVVKHEAFEMFVNIHYSRSHWVLNVSVCTQASVVMVDGAIPPACSVQRWESTKTMRMQYMGGSILRL